MFTHIVSVRLCHRDTRSSLFLTSDCSKFCVVGRLNDACDACICESTTVTGRVVTTVGSPIGGATIAPDSAPHKILAQSNSSGFFSLNATCFTTTVLVSKQGYQERRAEITGNTQNIEMKKESKYPSPSFKKENSLTVILFDRYHYILTSKRNASSKTMYNLLHRITCYMYTIHVQSVVQLDFWLCFT